MCRICNQKFKTGTRACRIRWNHDPVCRDCDNYVLEHFNYNGCHLTEYIDPNEYANKLYSNEVMIS